MAQPKPPPPTLQLVAIFSRYDDALDWALSRVQERWGRALLTSERFDHSETRYYESEMGAGLQKQFIVLQPSDTRFYDPARLAADKLESNDWERELAAASNYAEPRPVNLDPGYLTLMKLVLASAKDRAHRIYLHDGIYAEECLYYLDHRWQARPWTYPDYQRDDFQAFFVQARELLKDQMSKEGSS